MQENNNKVHTNTYSKASLEKLPFLNYGIIFSILVHIALFYILTYNPTYQQNINTFNVEILPITFIKDNQKELKSPNKIKNQIVDNSDTINNIVPKNTNLLSEKNNTVKKEQIKRGSLTSNTIQKIDNTNKITKQLKVNTQKFGSKNNNSISKDINNLSLKLDNETLFKNFGGSNLQKNKNNNDVPTNLLNYRPFSRPQGSGAKFLGSIGSSMYLPNLPDGDMTLLNTKAEYFAVFVRRVATRVFSELRQSGWENLSRNDINSINAYCTIEATMSLKGDILNVSLISSSGSFMFDDILKMSVKTAGKDSNPPTNAKSDDNLIHFIFQAKSWSKIGTNPNGSLGERRWLLLSTGLK